MRGGIGPGLGTEGAGIDFGRAESVRSFLGPPELDTEFGRALANASDLGALFDRPHPGVLVGRILSIEWCARLAELAAGYVQWLAGDAAGKAPANSMHQRGILMSELQLQKLVDALLVEVMVPVKSALFPELAAWTLESQHSYVVDYGDEGDSDLGFHVDDSVLTMNLCLGGDFDGSDLYFEGSRCPSHVDTRPRPEERFVWRHIPGLAVFHSGKHRHGVQPIRDGRRLNLIVWGQSAQERSEWFEAATVGKCLPFCGVAGTSEDGQQL